MTRINCIPPAELVTRHLVAEYRELPRVFALVRAAIARGETPDDPRNPQEYRLGAGHVRFFYSRLGYLVKRQAALVAEMQARGYKPTFTDPAGLLEGIAAIWCQDWEPDQRAIAENRARIAARLAQPLLEEG
jgi:deoxyribonuclease (pyrimidine dimer)